MTPPFLIQLVHGGSFGIASLLLPMAHGIIDFGDRVLFNPVTTPDPASYMIKTL
jgi:hypothetical protein